MKVLSICIPTYNRSELLGEAILSFIDQIDDTVADKIEICISDNCSNDGTELIVEQLKLRTKIEIVYNKNKKNLGADQNYMNVVKMASGYYCWFFGSDDRIKPNCIQDVLNALDSDSDIYLINRINCDIKMRPLFKEEWLFNTEDMKKFDTSSRNDLIAYLKCGSRLGALYSYLSSIIFKRKRWVETSFDQSFLGTAYSHAYVLIKMLKHGTTVQYVRSALVESRGGNDSFASAGELNRYMLDMNGYLKIANSLFMNDREIRDGIFNILRKEHAGRRLVKICALSVVNYKWDDVRPTLVMCGYDEKKLDQYRSNVFLSTLILFVFKLSSFRRKLLAML